MLKIKDNVDLKKLEEFGFEFIKGDVSDYYNLENDEDESDYIVIDADTREIRICSINAKQIDDTIYNLIEAGLVEKV